MPYDYISLSIDYIWRHNRERHNCRPTQFVSILCDRKLFLRLRMNKLILTTNAFLMGAL